MTSYQEFQSDAIKRYEEDRGKETEARVRGCNQLLFPEWLDAEATAFAKACYHQGWADAANYAYEEALHLVHQHDPLLAERIQRTNEELRRDHG